MMFIEAIKCLIPIVFFAVITLLYRGVNYHYFGVFETNTRNGGEPGRFVELVYSIDSPDRDAEVWAPYDAIKKAFEASPALSENERLLEAICTAEELDGDIYENPIEGDHLGWILRSALKNSGLWQEWSASDKRGSAEPEAERFFKRVNGELEAAFSEGRLKKTKGSIVFLKSMGSRSTSEIFSLIRPMALSYMGAVWLYGYEPGIVYEDLDVLNPQYIYMEDARDFVHVKSLGYDIRQSLSYRVSVTIVKIIFVIYRIVNSVLFAMLIFFILRGFVKLPKRIKEHDTEEMYPWLMSLCFLGISLLYTFSVAWFSSFLFKDEIYMVIVNFYNIALPALISISYIFALAGIVHSMGRK